MLNLSFAPLILINSTKIFTQPNNLTSTVKTSLPISPTPSPPNPPIPNHDGHWTTNNSCAMITKFGFLIPMIFSSEFSSISTTIYYLATTKQDYGVSQKRLYLASCPNIRQGLLQVLYYLCEIQDTETQTLR